MADGARLAVLRAAAKEKMIVTRKVAGTNNPTNSLSKYTPKAEYMRDMIFLTNCPVAHVGMFAAELGMVAKSKTDHGGVTAIVEARDDKAWQYRDGKWKNTGKGKPAVARRNAAGIDPDAILGSTKASKLPPHKQKDFRAIVDAHPKVDGKPPCYHFFKHGVCHLGHGCNYHHGK